MRVRPGGRRVRLDRPGALMGSLSGSSGSSGCAWGVAGYFCTRLVRSGAPWVSLCP